jgi:hypothetical protein
MRYKLIQTKKALPIYSEKLFSIIITKNYLAAKNSATLSL